MGLLVLSMCCCRLETSYDQYAYSMMPETSYEASVTQAPAPKASSLLASLHVGTVQHPVPF